MHGWNLISAFLIAHFKTVSHYLKKFAQIVIQEIP